MEHTQSEKPASPERGNTHAAGTIFIACVCGWVVMELEILGVRALVPSFGSAVYVVTGSVIGVFLLSLAVGYMLGGWLSGRVAAGWVLGAALTGAGVWMVAIPYATEPVCDAAYALGLDEKWGSLAAALVLFGGPTILLGTVSPTVVHRLTTQASRSGFNAGMILAVSTIASFAGCLVTAFYLVMCSLMLTLCVSGAVLVVLGVAILVVTAMERGEGRKGRVDEKRVK